MTLGVGAVRLQLSLWGSAHPSAHHELGMVSTTSNHTDMQALCKKFCLRLCRVQALCRSVPCRAETGSVTGALLRPQGLRADSRGGGGADPGAQCGHRRERGRQVGAGGLPGAAAGRARCGELHPRARKLRSHRRHPAPSSQRTGDLSTLLSMLPFLVNHSPGHCNCSLSQ